MTDETAEIIGPQSFFVRHKKTFWITLVSATVLTAGLVIWVLFFRDTTPAPKYEGEVLVFIGAPRLAPSGSQVSYEIVIDNRSNTALTGMALELFPPRGFTSSKVYRPQEAAEDPLPADQTTFLFPDLASGAQQELVVIGSLSGSVQEIKIFNAKLHYTPANFRSTFVAESSTNTVILAPEISLSVTAPPQLFSGQTITYEVQIANIADKEFANLVIVPNYPEKFELKESTATTEQDGSFKIPLLAVGETKKFSLTGPLLEGPGRESFMQVELFLNEVSAGRAYAFTQISPAPLTVSHRLTAPSEDKLTPGIELVYAVEYQNVGKVGLHDVSVTLFFETPVFDFSKIKLGSGQFRNNSVSWIPASVPALLAVNPSQKGKFEVSVPLAAVAQKNPTVKTRVGFTARELPEAASGNVLEYKLSSEVALAATARAISGSNPPAFGSSTTYRIDLQLTNTVNDVKGAVLQATIPRGETFFDPASIVPADEQAHVTFNQTSGLITWQVGDIFALTGQFHEPRVLSFNLTLTPGVGEQIQNLELLRNIVLTGTDSFTAKKISSNTVELLRAE